MEYQESSLGTEQKITREAKLNTVKDRLKSELGSDFYHIEPGILRPTIALNANEVLTTNSCEGHHNHGRIVPWISIGAPSRPNEQYIGQDAFEKGLFREQGLLDAYEGWLAYLQDFRQARDAMIQKAGLGEGKPSFTEAEAGEMDTINRGLMEKNHISDEDIEKLMAVLRAMDSEITKAAKAGILHEETKEYQLWNKEDQAILMRAKELIAGFEEHKKQQGIKTSTGNRLITHDSPYGHFIRSAGGGDYVEIDKPMTKKEKAAYEKVLAGKVPKKQQEALKGRIEGYQKEFDLFAGFLESKI